MKIFSKISILIFTILAFNTNNCFCARKPTLIKLINETKESLEKLINEDMKSEFSKKLENIQSMYKDTRSMEDGDNKNTKFGEIRKELNNIQESLKKEIKIESDLKDLNLNNLVNLTKEMIEKIIDEDTKENITNTYNELEEKAIKALVEHSKKNYQQKENKIKTKFYSIISKIKKQIKKQNKEIETLKNIFNKLTKEINLNESEINNKIHEIYNFKSIAFPEEIGINDKNIDNIFDIIVKINQIQNLTTLGITNQKNLTKIPEKIYELTSLENIDFSDNNIQQFPKDLTTYLTKLLYLNLSNNKNLTIPTKILDWYKKQSKGLIYKETKQKEQEEPEEQKPLEIIEETVQNIAATISPEEAEEAESLKKQIESQEEINTANDEETLNTKIDSLKDNKNLDFKALNNLENECTSDNLKNIINDERSHLLIEAIKTWNLSNVNDILQYAFKKQIAEE